MGRQRTLYLLKIDVSGHALTTAAFCVSRRCRRTQLLRIAAKLVDWDDDSSDFEYCAENGSLAEHAVFIDSGTA